MRIEVSGKQIDIGEALQTHVTQEVTAVAGKYAGRPTDAKVTFSRDAHLFCCEISVHLSTGLVVQAKGAATEIYAAFDEALDRMAKQLRRHKRRLKDHHKERPEPIETLPAAAFVLAPFGEEDEETEGGEAPGGAPAIIAETETRLPSLTVGEAVMQMELAHVPVLVFRNEKGGALNVVYRREDGNIGWIDPRPEAVAVPEPVRDGPHGHG
ncbi:SSU ribosomal protein S30P/sigma 54 modulation protein [Rubellimicrobium thermophilum DSM 16684]|uniref:Ribosome hibernation promoting factor n=1 Tax=Rubellimicrobium thermophilum DSM 16684 TaxID=1123069 RepID=S9R6R7_9RHOB|nr:ribosome-associated translation inhibitor RaiA [Rubellimicrobium thermophilum]EPX87663.1 SSU ribosomal protein S30P/sigma 54 modulation protein [Rubellimicrobium thermophilum DSM 16684]